MSLRWQNIVIDCSDPLLVASFWSEALGLELHGPEDGEWWIEPGGASPDILFPKFRRESRSRTGSISTCVRATRPLKWSGSYRSEPAGSTSVKVRSAGWSWPTRRRTSSASCKRWTAPRRPDLGDERRLPGTGATRAGRPRRHPDARAGDRAT